MSPGVSLSFLSCLSLLAALQLLSAGGTPAGAVRAVRFLSPWVMPALPDAGRAPSSWHPGCAGSLAGKGYRMGRRRNIWICRVWLSPLGLVWSCARLAQCRHLCVFSCLTQLRSALDSLCFGFAPGSCSGKRVPVMVDLCMSPNQTHSQGRRHWLQSVLALGCISPARHTPGSNLLLNPDGAGDPALSSGDCCHPLMTRLPLGLRCSHPIPPQKVMAAGHKAEEKQFPFPFLTSQRDPPQPFQRAGRMQSQLGWSRQTRVLSCHHPVPLPAGKHPQNPPARNCVDLGFPPGRLVQLLEARSSEAFTWCEEGGGGGGGGRQVQVLGFQHHIQAQRARSEQRSPPAPTSTQLARTTRPSEQRATLSPARWRVSSWGWQSPPVPLWEVGIAAGMPLHRGKVAAWFLLWLHGLVLRAGICSKLGFLSCFFWFCFVLNDSISPLNLHL